MSQKSQNNEKKRHNGRKGRLQPRSVTVTTPEQEAKETAVSREPAVVAQRAAPSVSSRTIVQPKLTVNPPDDQYEKEADQTAERVMRMSVSGVTAPVDGTPPDESPIQTMLVSRSSTAVVPNVSSQTEEQIAQMQNGGAPLPAAEKNFFESRMGHDFAAVRLHTGSDAVQTARDLQAKAFTVNNHIAFGAGSYEPGSSDGRKLLAHELTHTIQQTGGNPKTIQRAPVEKTVKGLTHLVEMKMDPTPSILDGNEQDEVWIGDKLIVDDEQTFRSRRGIDAEENREQYEQDQPNERWLKALSLARFQDGQEKDFGGSALYVREEMVSDPISDQDAAEGQLAVKYVLAQTFFGQAAAIRERASDYISEIYGQLTRLQRDQLPAELVQKITEAIASGTAVKQEMMGKAVTYKRESDALEAAGQNEGVINQAYAAGQRAVAEGISSLQQIEDNIVNVSKSVLDNDNQAADLNLFVLDLLATGNRLHADLQLVRSGKPLAGGSASSTVREKASTLLGWFATTVDIFGIIAASVGALAEIAALSAVVAGVGAFLGLIGAVLGGIFAYRSQMKANELEAVGGKLEGLYGDNRTEEQEQVIGLAEYGKRQKQTKSNRQVLGAVGAGVAGTMALIGLIGGPVGIAMAVLGALIGISFIVYQLWRKFRGKQAVKTKLINDALDGDAEKLRFLKILKVLPAVVNRIEPLNQEIAAKEVEINQMQSGPDANAQQAQIARKQVELRQLQREKDGLKQQLQASDLLDRLKSWRTDAANQLIDLVLQGEPSTRVGAELTLEKLGIDVEKVRTKWNRETAVKRISDKLSSW